VDKATKKRLKAGVRDHQRKAVVASFPLPVGDLRALFDSVRLALASKDCDRTRRLTKAWLLERGHAVDSVFSWLDEHNGFCDCQVVTNVRQVVDDAARASNEPANRRVC
jgi:hypothetical protein